MKLQAKLQTVAAAVIAATSFTTLADNSAGNNADIEVLTVTANRHAQNIDTSLSSQVVITRADIEVIQPKTTLDLLKSLAGVDISTQGGRGQNSSVFIRGANSNHTLVLVDGMRIGSATLGTTDIQSIAPDQIERIEVVKGPRAAIWGSDAIGGVIQIFTRQMDQGEHSLLVNGGSLGYQQLQGAVGFKHGDGGSSITLSKEESAGYDVLEGAEDDDDGFSNVSLSLNGRQSINEQLDVNWLLHVNNSTNEYDNAWGGNNEVETENYLWLTRAAYQQTIYGFNNLTTVTFGQSQDSGVNTKKGNTSELDSIFETQRQQFSALNYLELSADLAVNVGIDVNQEKVVASTDYDVEQRDIFGIFGQGFYNDGVLSAELAVRYDDVEGIDSESTVNAAIASFISDEVKVTANFGTGFKAPTFNDLYYPAGSYSSGNPDLVAETSTSGELTLAYLGSDLTTELSVYQSQVDNLIQWKAGANFFYKPENVNQVDIKGAELSTRYALEHGTHSVQISYNQAEDAETGLQLIRRAKQQVSYSFATQVNNIDLFAEYLYRGESFDEVFGLGRVKLKEHSLINLAASYQVNDNFDVKARLSNILDEQYQTSYDYNSAGQSIYLGVEYRN